MQFFLRKTNVELTTQFVYLLFFLSFFLFFFFNECNEVTDVGAPSWGPVPVAHSRRRGEGWRPSPRLHPTAGWGRTLMQETRTNSGGAPVKPTVSPSIRPGWHHHHAPRGSHRGILDTWGRLNTSCCCCINSGATRAFLHHPPLRVPRSGSFGAMLRRAAVAAQRRCSCCGCRRCCLTTRAASLLPPHGALISLPHCLAWIARHGPLEWDHRRRPGWQQSSLVVFNTLHTERSKG